MNGSGWREYNRALPTTVADAARTRLLQDYEPLTKERLDLGRHAGALPRADQSVYRWVRYKESYSPRLVRDTLDELLPKPSNRHDDEPHTVYDPMVGSGTSLLVAAERGLPAVGADLMPYATFLASTLSNSWRADPERVRTVAEDALSRYRSIRGQAQPDVPAAKWAFAPAVAKTLVQLLGAIDQAPAGVDRDLVRLAVLSGVEQVSYAVKDGTSLRCRLPDGPARPGRPGQQRRVMRPADVVTAVRQRVDAIVHDLERDLDEAAGVMIAPHRRAGIGRPGRAPVTVVQADARQWRPAKDSCRAVIFSPPYPNRYDYSAVYQLELALGGFVSDAAGLRRLRKQLLRSHLEAPPRDEYKVDLPALREFLAAVNGCRVKGDQAGRVLRMVAGFFEDMADVLRLAAETVCPSGAVALVVGTQTYFGQHLPTDVLIAELARGTGLEVRDLWVVRAKGVASQQRGLTTSASRETVVVLRKPPMSGHAGRRRASEPESSARQPRRSV